MLYKFRHLAIAFEIQQLYAAFGEACIIFNKVSLKSVVDSAHLLLVNSWH